MLIWYCIYFKERREFMKRKSIIVLLCLLLLSLQSLTNVSAKEESQDVSSIFKNFITECFTDTSKVHVSYNEKDVTDEFLAQYTDDYQSGDLSDIQEYLSNENVQIYYEQSTPQTRATESKSKVFTFYKYSWDTTKQYSKEWTVSLKTYVTYNANTYKVTSSKSPVLNLETASWGTSWTPYLANTSTSYKINSSKTGVTFSCTYTMKGTLSPYLWYSKDYNFGTYTHTATVNV